MLAKTSIHTLVEILNCYCLRLFSIIKLFLWIENLSGIFVFYAHIMAGHRKYCCLAFTGLCLIMADVIRECFVDVTFTGCLFTLFY